MAGSIEQIASVSTPEMRGSIGDIALLIIGIVLLAAAIQLIVARFLREHGRPAPQAENIATVAAAAIIAVLVPITTYIARS